MVTLVMKNSKYFADKNHRFWNYEPRKFLAVDLPFITDFCLLTFSYHLRNCVALLVTNYDSCMEVYRTKQNFTLLSNRSIYYFIISYGIRYKRLFVQYSLLICRLPCLTTVAICSSVISSLRIIGRLFLPASPLILNQVANLLHQL